MLMTTGPFRIHKYPYDEKVLSEIVKGISYNNAVKYFGFNLETK